MPFFSWIKKFISRSKKEQKSIDLEKVWKYIKTTRLEESEKIYWMGVQDHLSGKPQEANPFVHPNERIKRLVWEKGWHEKDLAIKAIKESLNS